MKGELYYIRRAQEQEKLMESSFWKDFIEEIDKERDRAVDRCVVNSDIDSLRKNQGKVEIIKRILELPDEMIKQKGTPV